jgi:transposase
MHLRCDGRGLPLAVVLTPGQAHESTAVDDLLEGLSCDARVMLCDRGYDADALREKLLLRGVLPVIPARSGRREPTTHDRALYRERNQIERLVNRLKQFRALATRYDKTAVSYLAGAHLAAIRVWLRYVHTP